MIKRLCVLAALLLVSACGGGGGGGSAGAASSGGSGGSTTTPPPVVTTPAANTVAITVDAGPASLDTGPNAYISDNLPFVSVTICAPGSTTNCQTIDHVIVDTGSIGLRIFSSVLNSTLLSALPAQTDANANPVGECYGYVDGYVFGSVNSADLQIGGEAVANMPLQLIGETGAYANVPSSCSSGGGPDLDTVQAFGANGVIGIGVTTTDCGATCTVAGGSGAAIYYDCPSTGCGSTITRAAATTAPFQQLPNPVAAMSVDNNGTILSLPAVASSGQTSASGTLIFGIGTQTNNALGAATVLTTTGSSDANGAGLVTVSYNGQSLPESFLDSGSNLYLFVDGSIAACNQSGFKGYYCPNSTLTLNATISGQNGASASGTIMLGNAHTLLSTSFSAVPNVGGNSNILDSVNAYPNSFDYGLPFFYGRNIYTAIEGRNAGGVVGPYFAF